MTGDHPQGMAAAAIAKPHMPLEVHLPEQVWRNHLKALGGGSSAGRLDDPTVPAQHLMYGRTHWTGQSIALQTACNLACSPRRMGVAHRQNALLNRRFGPPWARVRTTRMIRQALIGRPKIGRAPCRDTEEHSAREQEARM